MARLVFVFAFALGVAGCGSAQSELVVVTVHGTRANVTALESLVTLGGQQAAHLERFGADVADFGLALPDGARGALQVSVGGVDAQSCIVSFGLADGVAGDAGRLDLTVTLDPVSPPQCGS